VVDDPNESLWAAALDAPVVEGVGPHVYVIFTSGSMGIA
jgi:hypothetical protein